MADAGNFDVRVALVFWGIVWKNRVGCICSTPYPPDIQAQIVSQGGTQHKEIHHRCTTTKAMHLDIRGGSKCSVVSELTCCIFNFLGFDVEDGSFNLGTPKVSWSPACVEQDANLLIIYDSILALFGGKVCLFLIYFSNCGYACYPLGLGLGLSP